MEDQEVYNDSLVYDHHKANHKNNESCENYNTLEVRDINEEFGLKSANKEEVYIEEERKEIEITQREAKANSKSDNKISKLERNQYSKAESYCKGEANSCEENAILLTNQEEANEMLNMRDRDRENLHSNTSSQRIKEKGNDNDQQRSKVNSLNGNNSECAQYAKSNYSKVKKEERAMNTEVTSKETPLVSKKSILSNHSNIIEYNKDCHSKRSARSLSTAEKAIIRNQSKDFIGAVLEYAATKNKDTEPICDHQQSNVLHKPSKMSIVSTTSSHIKAKSKEFTNQVLEFNSGKRSNFN